QVQLIEPAVVPAALRGAAATTWDLRRDTISGLGHLEGKTVSVLSDGNVESQKVVAGGVVELDRPGAYGHIGLPYRAWIESLDINVRGSETVSNLYKNIHEVTLLVKDTRGLKAGPSVDLLEVYKERQFEGYDEP